MSNIFVRKGTPFSDKKKLSLLSETPLRSKNIKKNTNNLAS